MKAVNGFFSALGIADDESALLSFAAQTGVPVERLRFYNETNTAPSGHDLDRICIVANLSPAKLLLHMGILDESVLHALQRHAGRVFEIIRADMMEPQPVEGLPKLAFSTDLGRLYQGDCLQLMPHMESDSIDLIFAAPPTDMEKLFPDLGEADRQVSYLLWCETWLQECIRLLKPGASLFLVNEPNLNVLLAPYLGHRLSLRHWIAVEMEQGPARPSYLQSSHRSVLYYCKGERPRAFHPDRLLREVCPSCNRDHRAANRRRKASSAQIVRMTDLWTDMSPKPNARIKKAMLARAPLLKLLDRILELATQEGDIVLDPFGGSGTTFVVAEVRKRRWVGIDPEGAVLVRERFAGIANEAVVISSFRKEYQRVQNCPSMTSPPARRR